MYVYAHKAPPIISEIYLKCALASGVLPSAGRLRVDLSSDLDLAKQEHSIKCLWIFQATIATWLLSLMQTKMFKEADQTAIQKQNMLKLHLKWMVSPIHKGPVTLWPVLPKIYLFCRCESSSRAENREQEGVILLSWTMQQLCFWGLSLAAIQALLKGRSTWSRI